MQKITFSSHLLKEPVKDAPRSERGEIIGWFLEKLNADRKPPYKPLKAARVGMMLAHLTTPNLRAFYRECECAGHFSKFYWWKFKSAKETK